MTNQPPRSSAFGTIAGFALGLVVATAVTLVAVWLFFRDPSRVDVSRPTVVQQIQQLQRLETVVYSMEKIVTGSQESKYLPRMLAGDRLLLIVHGEVTAGVDLGMLDASQLTIDGRTVTINLPEASVFSTRLDNARTRVYARETGLFTSPDPELESEVRREAERASDLDEPPAGAGLRGGEVRRGGLSGRLLYNWKFRPAPRSTQSGEVPKWS
jgi:hypothetical protein